MMLQCATSLNEPYDANHFWRNAWPSGYGLTGCWPIWIPLAAKAEEWNFIVILLAVHHEVLLLGNL